MNHRTRMTPFVPGLLSLLLITTTTAEHADRTQDRPSPLRPPEAATLGATPRGFIPNVGQLASETVRFTLRDRGMTAHFTDHGFVLWRGESTTITQDGIQRRVPVAPRWEVIGANRVEPVGGDAFGHTVSFFLGNDPAKWRPNVPAYRDLRYPEILPGVELRVEGRERGFEYSFHVQPDASPDLRLRYNGVTALEIQPNGDLKVHTAGGHFTESRPIAFQWIDGTKCDVASRFEIVSGEEYRIVVGSYDKRHELVIDPVLDWSTSIGGSHGDQINVIKMDPFGEIIVAGVSHSVNLPTTAGFAPFGTDAGENFGTNPQFPEHSDVYIAKFSTDGTEMLWAGYLGGEGAHPESIGRNKPLAIDASGDVYITTHTQSPDFPIYPVGSSAHQGGTDASITRIKADGSVILWSRLLGAGAEDHGYAVAVHGNDLYLSGVTTSPNFPVTARSFGGMQDAFIAKLSAADGVVGWSAFLGGSNEERISALVANAGGVIVFGDTDSADYHASDFPAPAGHDRSLGGGNDTFLTKIDPSGGILWSTYLGGSEAETSALVPIQGFTLTWGLSDMTLDTAGNIIAAGHTYSPDFPGTGGRFQPALVGSMDGYIAKLTPDGSQVLWSTYLGGSGPHDRIVSVAVNPWNEIHVGGGTSSLDFPTTSNGLKPTMQADGFQDGFMATLDPDGQQLLYSTYIGNNGWHDAVLALDYGFGRVVIGGWHFDTFFQITAGTFRQECDNCGHETFLMNFLDAYIAHDGFETSPSAFPNSGTGSWTSPWTVSGDSSILTSSGPHSGARHARLRSSSGYLQRTLSLPPASTSVSLGFWAKVDSFEGSDRADILVRSTGASFTPVASFTAANSDNTYHYYELNLSTFLPATQIHIAFDALMNANNDYLYLDDIRLTGTSGSVPPIASAGADQTVTDTDNTGSEAVTLNGSASSDPDGGGIVGYEWKEGATVLGNSATISPLLAVGPHTITLTVQDDEGAFATDTVQVTVNPFVPPVQVFSDSFEVGEWNGLWTEDSQNDWFRSSQRASAGAGSWSAEVDGSATDASLTSVAINLQGRTSATISFDWLIESGLDSGEHLEFRVSTNGGSTWTQKAILRGNVDPENSWRAVSVSVTGISQLRLQFRGRMNASDEDANVDNVKVVAY